MKTLQAHPCSCSHTAITFPEVCCEHHKIFLLNFLAYFRCKAGSYCMINPAYSAEASEKNNEICDTKKTQSQTPQNYAGTGTVVVGRGHGQICYFKQNLRGGCVLSHRKSVVLVRAVNHATWGEIRTVSPHDFSFQQLFSSSEMTCIYFRIANCSTVASVLRPCWWKPGGSPGRVSHAVVTKLTSLCLFQADREKEKKNVQLTSMKTTLHWIILLCASTTHSL